MLGRIDGVNNLWKFFFTEEPAPERYEGPREVGQFPNECWCCNHLLFDLTKTDDAGNHPPLDGKKVIAHKKCPPLHQECWNRMQQQANLRNNGCPTCREPLAPPAPAPISLQEYAVYCIRWGLSAGARGLVRISGEVIYSLFWTAVVAGSAFALNIFADSASVERLLGGPVIGGLVGTVFGAAMVGGVCHLVFGIGSHLVEKMRVAAKVRFNQPARIAIAIALSGVAAALAWKIAFFAGNLLMAEWAKVCLAPNQIPTVLEFLWKVTMDKGLLMGMSEACVVTLAQIELFAVAALTWGAITWGRRVWNEEIPRWNLGQR